MICSQSAEAFVGQESFSFYVSQAVRQYVERLQWDQLAEAMKEGYRAETESPSLDPEWSNVELDDWR